MSEVPAQQLITHNNQ